MEQGVATLLVHVVEGKDLKAGDPGGKWFPAMWAVQVSADLLTINCIFTAVGLMCVHVCVLFVGASLSSNFSMFGFSSCELCSYLVLVLVQP